MIKMRKLFFKLSMLLFVLGMSTNAAWADETPSGQAMYLASFKAQSSSESTGSGKVKLTWVDVRGRLFVNEIVSFINDPSTMPYGTGNPSNSDVFSSEAMVMGTTMTATESVEENDPEDSGTQLLRYILRNSFHLDTTNIYITPFAYYKADAQGDNGSYFAGWTFNDARVWQQDTAMDKSAPESAYFKVLPNPKNVWYLDPSEGLANLNEAYAGAVGAPNNIYAVFNKYLLGNPTATSKNVLQQKDAIASLDVYVDVEGDISQLKEGHADFVTPTFSGKDEFSSWECAFASPTDYEEISATKRRYHFVVTYTALDGITEGKHSATLTISMAGANASTLNIPVSVMARAASSKDASVKIGDTTTEYATLASAVEAANAASGDIILALLRDVSGAVELKNTMTFDLNGYTLNNTLTVNGSNKKVTLAYNKLGGEILDEVIVRKGSLVLDGGNLASLSISAGTTVEQNGATIMGSVANAGVFTATNGTVNGGLTSTAGTLTLNGGSINGTTAVTISGGTAYINKGTLNGTSCGLLVSGGIATVKKLVTINADGSYSAKQEDTGVLNVESGKFNKPLNGNINFGAGYFKTNNYGVSSTGKTEFLVSAGTEYDEGYRYFLGDAESALENGVGVCRIGTTSYARLEDALAYANNNPNEELVIFMTNDYTLPAGYYTLPAKATIVVPMSDTQAKEINYTAPRLVYNDINNASSNRYENNPLTEFRRLTFANGVKMDVFGDIELTGTQYSTNEAYTSQPVGPYGRLVMEEGSHMTLQNHSELRAWGFMTGKGETDARRGATVREMFQMGDWKGAMTSVAITGMVKDNVTLSNIVQNTIVGSESGDYSDKKIFPVTQYFIQNVESPVKYHPGAKLSTSAAVSEGISNVKMSISMAATDITVVGVSGQHTAIFLMDEMADAENTWVRKWYDAEHDIQVYDINSGAHIGSMELNLGDVSLLGQNIPVRLNSSQFDLPLTNNFKIHLLSGTMDFQQNTCLLPGAEIEVDKESTVTVAMSAEDKEAKAAGTPDHVYHTGALYVYDKAEWDRYAYNADNNKFTKVVRYTPSALNGEGGRPTSRNEDTCPESAKIFVHGTFNTMDGYVYTSAGGAEIYSSNEDAGTFIFGQSASEAGSRDVYQIKGKGTKNNQYESKPFTSAKLKNGAGAATPFTETSSANANQVFMYRDNEWKTSASEDIKMVSSGCFTVEMDMNAYGGLVSSKKEDIYVVHAPNNIAKYFVTKPIAESVYPQYAPMSAAAFEYAKATMSAEFASYAEQIDQTIASTKSNGYTLNLDATTARIFIKPQEWVEIAGTIRAVLSVDADEISAFGDAYATAVATESGFWTGCNTAVADYKAYIDEQAAHPQFIITGNADHTFSDAAGAGRLFILMNDGCQWWEVEKKDNLYHCIHPDNDTYYYWVDEVIETNGSDDPEDWDITPGYWAEKKFTITWLNWDGTPIETNNGDDLSYSVTYGTMAEFLGTNPTREATVDYTYDFTGWSPALGPVTSDVTYTATYAQKDRMYTIIFQNEGGVEIERQFLKLNDIPACENTPTKIGHTLVWSPAIAAVTGNATYTAIWEEDPPTEYEVIFYDYNGTTELQKGNVAVGAMPEYTGATPTGKTTWAEEQDNKEFTYVFDHWVPALELVSATSIKSYTAVYREEPVTYTVRFFQADGETQIGEDQNLAYGAVPSVPSAGITEPGEDGYTYTYVWENMDDDSKMVEAVKANADYKPRFTGEKIKYTVKLKSNPSEACTFTGAGIYNHGDAITISQTAKPNYTFTQWTDENGQVVNALPTTVTADIDLIANFTFEGTGYTITWNNWNGTQLASGSQKENTATTYVGATPTREASESTTYTFYGWYTKDNEGDTLDVYKNGMTPKATANATYYAYFNETARKYTISWKNEAGTADIEVDYEQPYGATIEYNSATPTKVATAEATYTFDGWATSANGEKVYNNGSTPAVSGDATYYAHFKATPREALEIGLNDIEEIVGQTTLNTLIITSDGVSSGQLKGAENLNVYGEAIFRQQQSFVAGTWYAVAVPWRVDPNVGIYGASGRLASGSQIYIIEFDAAAYANVGGTEDTYQYWHFLHQTGADMVPGKLYMIYLTSAQPRLDFHKKSGADLLTSNLTVSTASGSAGSQFENWNAIANPALYTADLSTGASRYQTYDNNNGQTYTVVDATTSGLIVAKPIFVQINTPATVYATVPGGASPAPAYRRAPQAENDTKFVVEIAQNNKMADRLIVETTDEKENRYVIGQDLAKFGVSSKVAQMWINRYDAKLCVNTMETADVTDYPMSIFAPKAGEYQISNVKSQMSNEDYSLYLTYNGEAIWNLSDGAYVLNLNKGTDSNYGLRVSARAPQTATGVDEAIVDAQGDVRKVLINNQVFIIRGDKVYSIDGQLVK